MNSTELPPLPEPSTFASDLIKARTALGLTQSALSHQSGLSLSAIKAYETGRNLPGARELRELCQVLQVSPNKLLFGSEQPFGNKSLVDQFADGPPENDHVRAARTASLMLLLASDESASVLTLVRALAAARHGEEKVRQAVLGADLMVGMSRELASQAKSMEGSGALPAPGDFGAHLEAFMDRQGHIPDPKKST